MARAVVPKRDAVRALANLEAAVRMIQVERVRNAKRAANMHEQMAAKKTGMLARFWDDVPAFAKEFFYWRQDDEPTPYQVDSWNLLHKSEERRCAVRGGRGSGKSTTASHAVIHFAITRELAEVPWKILTSAGAELQLERYLWPEIHLWLRRFRWDLAGIPPWRDGHELLRTAIQLKHGQAFAAAPKDSKLMEGLHAQEVLVVFDEAAAIPDASWDSVEGSFATAVGERRMHWLAIGKPADAEGRFWKIHTKADGHRHWKTRHITKEEAIKSARVSHAWVERMRKTWRGEHNPAWLNHVCGEFADSGAERSVIPLWAIELATKRYEALAESGELEGLEIDSYGLDVGTGQPGRDPAVLAEMSGNVVKSVGIVPPHPDPKMTEMHLAGFLRPMLTGFKRAAIETNGYGGGTYSRLAEDLQAHVVAFSPSEGTERRTEDLQHGFRNSRSCAWWIVREMAIAEDSTFAIPDDADLIGELSEPKFSFISDGRIAVESKEDIASRLSKRADRSDEGTSTNRADAVIVCSWLRGAARAVIPKGFAQARVIPIGQYAPRRAGKYMV